MSPSRLAAVGHVHERQAARIEGGEAFDVIGLHQGEPGANAQVFRVRDGAVVDRQAFYVENAAGRDQPARAGKKLVERCHSMKSELTESSLLMRSIVSAMSSAADRQRMRLQRLASSRSGIVSVTTS